MENKSAKAILVYTIRGYRGVTGQVVGMDGSGEYVKIFRGETFEDCMGKLNKILEEVKQFSFRYRHFEYKVYQDLGSYYQMWEEIDC